MNSSNAESDDVPPYWELRNNSAAYGTSYGIFVVYVMRPVGLLMLRRVLLESNYCKFMDWPPKYCIHFSTFDCCRKFESQSRQSNPRQAGSEFGGIILFAGSLRIRRTQRHIQLSSVILNKQKFKSAVSANTIISDILSKVENLRSQIVSKHNL